MRQTRLARAPTTARAQYDAAGTGRRLAGWNPPSTGPQRAIQGLPRIRSRAQDAVRNDWTGASATQKWTTTLVGSGITPRWANERHAEVWADFVPNADADGVLDAYGLQALAVRSWFSAGEVFMRRRWRRVGGPLAIPVQVQLIESDFCPLFDADQWPGMPADNRICQGIEIAKLGGRVAYWMHREHPGDGPRSFSAGSMDLIRIPADQISHVFEPKRPGQLRGVSELAPILTRLRSAGDFEDTVLERQKLANLFTLFLTKQIPSDWQNLQLDPTTGLPLAWNTKGQPMAGLEPGVSMELLPGEDVKFASPPDAGVAFADYMRTLGLGMASGGGLPYELLTGDGRDISDRTLRVLIQEFRRFATQRQWHLVIPKICQPMVQWVGDAAVLAGRLHSSERKAFGRPEWSPTAWDYIHPVQDVQSKKLMIEAGITSRSAVVAERGEDPRKVQEQREADALDDKARGLTVRAVASIVGPNPEFTPGIGGPGDVPKARRGGDDPLVAIAGSMVTMAGQMVDAIRSLGLAAANKPVTVTNNVEVPPLQVEAIVTMPDRVSETTLTHDDDGKLVGSSTVERTSTH